MMCRSALAHLAASFGSRLVVVATLGVAAGLLITGPLADAVRVALDGWAGRLAARAGDGSWVSGLHTISLAGTLPSTAIAAVAFGTVRAAKTRSLAPLALSVIAFDSAALVTVVIKMAVRRGPVTGPVRGLLGGSFPSGHVLMAATVYGVAIVLVKRSRLRPILRGAAIIGLAALVVTIAFARVYLRLHYLSDVIASLALGTALIGIMTSAERQAQVARSHAQPTGSQVLRSS